MFASKKQLNEFLKLLKNKAHLLTCTGPKNIAAKNASNMLPESHLWLNPIQKHDFTITQNRVACTICYKNDIYILLADLLQYIRVSIYIGSRVVSRCCAQLCAIKVCRKATMLLGLMHNIWQTLIWSNIDDFEELILLSTHMSISHTNIIKITLGYFLTLKTVDTLVIKLFAGVSLRVVDVLSCTYWICSRTHDSAIY